MAENGSGLSRKHRTTPPQVHTFGRAMLAYIQRCKDKGRAPATVRDYTNVMRYLEPLAGRTLESLRPSDFEAVYTWMREEGSFASSTMRKTHVLAMASLKLAERNEWVSHSVARLAEAPTLTKKKLVVPSEDQVRTLLDCARKHNPLVWRFARIMAGTGMRPGECAALMHNDLDGSMLTVQRSMDCTHGHVGVKPTKSGDARTFEVDEGTAKAILTGERPYVFRGGYPWRTDKVFDPFRRIAVRCGVYVLGTTDDGEERRFTPHKLRHFNATQLAAAGYTWPEISRRLGHRNASITMDIYTGVLPVRDTGAAKHMGTLLGGWD